MKNGRINRRTGEMELMLQYPPKDSRLSDGELRNKFQNKYVADCLIKLRQKRRELEEYDWGDDK